MNRPKNHSPIPPFHHGEWFGGRMGRSVNDEQAKINIPPFPNHSTMVEWFGGRMDRSMNDEKAK
jgi:hypothetical protein